MKEILSRSTKTHTVTELLISRVCQLTLPSHITTYWIKGDWPSLRITKLGPAEAQEKVTSVKKPKKTNLILLYFWVWLFILCAIVALKACICAKSTIYSGNHRHHISGFALYAQYSSTTQNLAHNGFSWCPKAIQTTTQEPFFSPTLCI